MDCEGGVHVVPASITVSSVSPGLGAAGGGSCKTKTAVGSIKESEAIYAL